MLRSESRLDPEVVAELERLDAVLAGDREADPLLALLAEDVAATRPRLDADARVRLEARTDAVRVRVARPRKAVWRGRFERPSWRLGLALAAVAAVAVPVAGGLALDQSRDETASVVNQSLDERNPSQQAAGPDASATEALPSSGGSSGAAQQLQSRRTSERRVVRDVRQTLRVARGEVAGATARIATIVGDAGGYLASSEVRERGASAGGTFEVVVPSAQLDATVARLSRVGSLVRLERSSRDVTDQAASLDDRLKDVRADRAALRLQLARTVDPQRRAARRRELRVLSSRVARLEGEQRSLRQQTDTTRIGLRLTTSSAAGAGPSEVDDGGWGLGQAWHDAGRVLGVVAGGLLVGAAVVVPVALVALGAVLLRRRRRRAAGDRLIDGA